MIPPDPDEPAPARLHPKRVENEHQAFIFVGDKELKRLQQAAWKAGWWPEQTKSGILWLAPDGVDVPSLTDPYDGQRMTTQL